MGRRGGDVEMEWKSKDIWYGTDNQWQQWNGHGKFHINVVDKNKEGYLEWVIPAPDQTAQPRVPVSGR